MGIQRTKPGSYFYGASLGKERRTGKGDGLLQHRLIEESRQGRAGKASMATYMANVYGFLPTFSFIGSFIF